MGVRIITPQSQCLFIYTSDTGKTSNSQRRLWISAFLVCLRAKEPMAVKHTTKCNTEQQHVEAYFTFLSLPLLGWTVKSERTVSYLIKQHAPALCCYLSIVFIICGVTQPHPSCVIYVIHYNDPVPHTMHNSYLKHSVRWGVCVCVCAVWVLAITDGLRGMTWMLKATSMPVRPECQFKAHVTCFEVFLLPDLWKTVLRYW